MLDLRRPAGWYFLLLAVILIATGLTTPERQAPLTPMNVNLYTGIAMAVFGGTMLWLARARG